MIFNVNNEFDILNIETKQQNCILILLGLEK